MKPIKIDIDGILRDFVGSVYNVLKQVVPNVVPEKEPFIDNWDIHKFYPDIPEQEFYRLVFNTYANEIFSLAKPYPEMLEFMTSIRGMGYTIFLFTQQSAKTAKPTISWVEKHRVPFDYFIFTETQSKNILSGSLIDDKPDNITSKSDIILTRPWNEYFEWKRRASNYDEILTLLEKGV